MVNLKNSKIIYNEWFIGIVAGIVSSFLFAFIITPYILDERPNFVVMVEEVEMTPNSQQVYGNEGSFYWKDSFRRFTIDLNNFNSSNEVEDLVFIMEFEGDVFKLIHNENQDINNRCKILDSKVYLINGLNDIKETTALQLRELRNEKIQGSNKIIVNCERIGQKGNFELDAFVDLKGRQMSTTCLYKWSGAIKDHWDQCDLSYSTIIKT